MATFAEMRARFAFAVVVLAGCPRSHEPVRHTLPAVSASPSVVSVAETKPSRWVPRVSTWTPMPAETRDEMRLYGPMPNNFGSHASVYLGHRTVALVDHGSRWLWKDGALSAIHDPTPRGLDTIDRAPSGFVLGGTGGVFYAPAIDAPLVELAHDPNELEGIGPQCVLVRSGFVGFDGKPIPTAPTGATTFVTHSRGFALAQAQGALWFTRDCRAWTRLSVPPSSAIVEDGATLLVADESSPSRVSESGVATPVTLTQDERLAAMMKSGRGGALADDGFEGSLLDSDWSPAGTPGTYFRVENHDIEVMTARDHAVRRIGKTKEDGCGALLLERPLIVCIALAQHLAAYHVDLATGALELERAVTAKGGKIIQFVGVPRNTYPPTLFAAASCDGDPEGGLCVRDEHGAWKTFPRPTTNAWVLPGEVFHFTDGPRGTMALHDSRRLVSSGTPPPELLPKGDAGRMEDFVTVDTGILRTDSELVAFEGPNPSIPIPAGAKSYAIRYPIAATPTTATVTAVSGVVATAGKHALRLDGGTLYETCDGWKTWTRIPPPPTGPLTDLGGAQCFEMGCIVGAWDRIGWTSP